MAKRESTRRSVKPTATTTSTWQQRAGRYWRRYRMPLARVATIAAISWLISQSFLIINFRSFQNYLEVFLGELWLPTVLNLLLALAITAIVYAIKRPATLGGKLFAAVLLTLVMVDYDTRLQSLTGFFRAFVPILPKPDNDQAILSLLFLAILVALAIWCARRIEQLQGRFKDLTSTNITGAIVILVGILAFGQLSWFLGVAPDLQRQTRLAAPDFQTGPPADPSKPDIYYIVLDRYTNNSVLREQFGYDNSGFTSFLTSSGFQVNENAYSNYPYTAQSISSSLTGSYNTDILKPRANDPVQPRTLFHGLVYQAPAIKALKASGYQYYTVGSWYGLSNRAPLADREYMWENKLTVFGRSKSLRGMEATEFEKTVFYRLAKVGSVSWWPLKYEQHTQVDDIREQLSSLKRIATEQPSGGRLIFAHMLIPHDPYYFNADGSLATHPEGDNVAATNKTKYTGQVSFINDQMRDVISTITTASQGKAVILLNADEGAWPNVLNSTALNPTAATSAEGSVDNNDMTKWPDDWLRMKYGILQATNLPGLTDAELANLSSVNLFRIITNRYAGTQLSYLPNCNLALLRGTEYSYDLVDITKRLQPESTADCAQFQSHTR